MRLWRESCGPPRARKRGGATLGGPLRRRRFLAGRLVYLVELRTQPGLQSQRRAHRRLAAAARAPPQPLLGTQEMRWLSAPGGSPGQAWSFSRLLKRGAAERSAAERSACTLGCTRGCNRLRTRGSLGLPARPRGARRRRCCARPPHRAHGAPRAAAAAAAAPGYG